MTNLKKQPIGIFDSGMGGVSVLREQYRLMPNEDYLFFGDSANAPYGSRPVEEARELTFAGVEKLLDMGAKCIVIGCNTATSAAIVPLRAKYPNIPIIGLEPAIKPAALEHPDGRVLILATELTIHLAKCQRLMEKYHNIAHLIPLEAPGLMNFVEAGEFHTPALAEFLNDLLRPYVEEPVDAVVLGCTHYPFVKEEIAEALGYPVTFYDGGEGTARETRAQLERFGLRNEPEHKGVITFLNSDPSGRSLALSKKLFEG